MTQIYCDFSGYTDMARAIARMFGIALGETSNIHFSSLKRGLLAQLAHQPVDMAARYLFIPIGGSRGSLSFVRVI